jgi:hypothetical protein
MTGPYRKPQALPPSEVKDRLACWLRDGDKNRWVRAVYVKLWVTAIACGFIGSSDARLAAIPAALLGGLWAFSDYRKRRGASVVLTVRTGRVMVEGKSGKIDVSLDELEEVRLDTKSTSKNLTVARADGVNSLFGASSNHNIEVDVSRIELHLAGDEQMLLDEEFISASLCAEQMRAIRLFLRAHGWKPLDER